MTGTKYRDSQREQAAAWKLRCPDLPQPARAAAAYVGKDGTSGRVAYNFCLPPEFAAHNLLPAVRDPAVKLFTELGIPWHAGVDGGPGNHLLSSQVQCVNALMPAVTDPELVHRLFGRSLDIIDVLQIEPGRYLTFEFIGPTDFFGESPGRPRVRGTRCTSVDAAFLFRASGGTLELALVEWKYVEDYRRPRLPEPSKDQTRRQRYSATWDDPAGPLRTDVLDFEDILDEPFYQLVRQQLLAYRLEESPALGADVVRVVHVHPTANEAYQASLVRESHRALGDTVDEVWRRLLRRQDRFITMPSENLLDPSITNYDYVDRYGPRPLR